MPKKKQSKTLQRCNCCNFESTNIWNHILNSKECKQYYNDNRQFHVPTLNTSSTSHQSSIKERNIIHSHHKLNPSSTYAMFGGYVSLQSITPIINNIDNCDDAFDFDFCSDNDIDKNDTNEQHEENTAPKNIDNDQQYQSSSLTPTINDYSIMSDKMNNLISNSVFNPATLLSIKLFKILSKANAPLYLFDELNTFMKHSVPVLVNSKTSKLLKRNKLLSTLYSIIFNQWILTCYFHCQCPHLLYYGCHHCYLLSLRLEINKQTNQRDT